jgi:hypothetical protein
MYSNLRLTCIAAAVATLTACGGGGGGGNGIATAPVDDMTTLPVTVMDGLIAGANVCLDVNANGSCEEGDIRAAAPTDTSGNASITVAKSEVGKYPVLAMVPVGAVDASSGPVTTAYVLTAPADQSAVVSPLTTVVQHLVASGGVNTSTAANVVQAQGGLSNSPLANYLAADDKVAANAARVLVAAMQKQTEDLKSNVGQADSHGTLMTDADIQNAIWSQAGAMLASAVTHGNDASLVSACSDKASAACASAVTAAVDTVVAAKGLTASNLPAKVAVAKITTLSAVPGTPTAGFQLDWVNFGDPSNWYTRVSTWTAAEDTPDANGLVRGRSIRRMMQNGVEAIWGNNSNPARTGDLHWNGSAWVGCLAESQTLNTVPDAQGRSNYNYCDGFLQGAVQRVESDIAGKSMSSVFAFIQSVRGDPNWGKAPTWFSGAATANVDGAVFPAGSKLYAQTDTYTDTAITYDVRSSNVVQVAPADASVGGDARVDQTLPCYLGYTSTASVTLDVLIARSSGTPCLVNPSDSSVTAGNGQVYFPGAKNENWQATTASIGKIGTAPTGASTATDFYTTNKLYRVGFAGGASQATTYYVCQERVNNGSARNCAAVGNGTYAIETLGDARIMRFTGLPAAFASLDSERVFVERGGETYFGFKIKLSSGKLARLNGTAGNAVLRQLGLATIAP